jgi:DNA repair exonuclease SbcCD ATPase subunit
MMRGRRTRRGGSEPIRGWKIMSKTETKTRSSDAPAAEANGPTTTTRIDSAHAINNPPSAAGASTEPPTGNEGSDNEGSDSETVLAEQFRLQAAQLSDQLSERQKSLDRRESEVNARLAALESETRRARLWLEQRQGEIEKRQQQLDGQLEGQREAAEPAAPRETKAAWKTQEKQLRAREKELKAREKALLSQTQQADKRQANLDRREQLLNTTMVEVSDGDVQLAAARLALDGQQMQAQSDLDQRKEKLDALAEQQRQREQHAAEQLSDEQARLAEQLADDRFKLAAKAAQEKTRLAAERSTMEKQIASERLKLAGERTQMRKQLILDQSKLAADQQQLLKDEEEVAAVLAERRTLFEAAARLDTRQQHLEKAESLLEEEHGALVEQRRALAGMREDREAQARAAQQQFAGRRVEQEAQWKEKRGDLERRSQALQAREKAIDHLRTEISNTHRDTLEMRVAIEEIWSQLSTTMRPAALTQSLSGARSRLSDYYRLANAEMAERKEELQRISRDMAQQHQQLAANKTELQQWAARRQEEIEVQAARLVGREQELDRQESECGELRRAWQQERLMLQQQLRSRLAELRCAEPAVA